MNRHQLIRLLVVVAIGGALLSTAGGTVWGAQPGQGEFVPMKDLPQAEALPAAPLLVAAYVFVWLALLAFVWSVWRRMGALGRDLAELQRRVGKQPKA